MRKRKTTEDYSWINDDPLEIDYNADESEFIPIFYIEQKLTKLDPFWGTENFKFQFIRGGSNVAFADGSLEIVVMYGGRIRRLVGAATILVPANTDFTDPMVNTNYGATIKSECIKNGVKAIGRSFGSHLNERDIIFTPANKTLKNGAKKRPAVKMKADKSIREAYAKAVVNNDTNIVTTLENAYDFN